MLTAAVCAASYGFYRYVKTEEKYVSEMRGKCACEAYVTLCESIVRGDASASADALSRCELFAGCGGADALRFAILSGSVDEKIAEALAIDGDASPSEIAEAVRRADRAAENAVGGTKDLPGVSNGGEWETVAAAPTVTEEEARRTAAEIVGGGASFTTAKSHTFPLVYSFVCKNASVDITRMGGRLLRFYAFRHGGAEVRDEETCRASAEKFVRAAGIADASLVSAREYDEEFDFVFCGSFPLDGVRVDAVDEAVNVRVAKAGASVCFFDASEYYRRKPSSYGSPNVVIGRAEASRMLGVGGENLSLVYSEGEMFWRFCGVKILLLNAKTGKIRPQNP